jgi:hypothetical protein
VDDILAEWVAKEIIAEEIYVIKNGAKGYRKLLDL